MAKLNVEIPDSLHKALKRISVDKSTPMKRILTDLIKGFIGKEEKDPPKKSHSQNLLNMGQYRFLKNFLAIELEYLVKLQTIRVDLPPSFQIRAGMRQQSWKMIIFEVHGPNLSVTLQQIKQT